MKRLLSLLSVVLVSSPAGITAGTSFGLISEDKANREEVKSNKDRELDDNSLKNEGQNDKEELEVAKTDLGAMQVFYNQDDMNFKADIDNKIVTNNAKLEVKHNGDPKLWTSINTIKLVKKDENDISNLFRLNTLENNSKTGIFTTEIILREDKLDDLEKMDKDYKLNFEINYLTLDGNKTERFSVNVHIKKDKPALVVKEQLNSYLGRSVININNLETTALESDNEKFVKDLTDKIDREINSKLSKDQWHFVSEPSITARNTLIEVNDDNDTYTGRVLIKYQLKKLEKAIPNQLIELGELEGLDKYTVSKGKKYENYIHFENTLSKWYEKNMSATYERDFDFVAPKNNDASIKINGDTKTMLIQHVIRDLNGEFKVKYTVPYASLEKYINTDLGELDGVTTSSTKQEIQNAIIKKFNSIDQYKDFKDMFTFDAPSNYGKYSETNTVTIFVKRQTDSSKQIFQSGQAISLNYRLAK